MVCEGFKEAGCIFSFAEGRNERYCLFYGRLLLWVYLRPRDITFSLRSPQAIVEAHIYSLHAARRHIVA